MPPKKIVTDPKLQQSIEAILSHAKVPVKMATRIIHTVYNNAAVPVPEIQTLLSQYFKDVSPKNIPERIALFTNTLCQAIDLHCHDYAYSSKKITASLTARFSPEISPASSSPSSSSSSTTSRVSALLSTTPSASPVVEQQSTTPLSSSKTSLDKEKQDTAQITDLDEFEFQEVTDDDFGVEEMPDFEDDDIISKELHTAVTHPLNPNQQHL